MKSKSSVTRKDSRFVQGGTVDIHEKSVGWWERFPELSNPADDDIIIDSLDAVYDGRPDLLAYDLYGSNNLEWIILQFNNIVDIHEEFTTGSKVAAPSKARVFSRILIKQLPSKR